MPCNDIEGLALNCKAFLLAAFIRRFHLPISFAAPGGAQRAARTATLRIKREPRRRSPTDALKIPAPPLPTNLSRHRMKSILAAALLTAAIALPGSPVNAQTSAAGAKPAQPCAIGNVTGVGGSPQSVHDYLASPERDRYRFLNENQIQCQVSDEGRASGCTGITSLRHERVSVYDDSDPVTTTVIAHVELDHGTYPAMIVVPKSDLQCETSN
jgi:hypothetical protein